MAHGYENATTKVISAAAGIHEATLFRNYSSKLGLVEEAVKQRLADTPLNRVVYIGIWRLIYYQS